MNNLVELKNMELYEFCMLDKETGKIEFSDRSKISGFTGLYFRHKNTFLGIYPTKSGPMIYFKGKEYSIHPYLSISLFINGKNRKFIISEYNIEIEYTESPYIGIDMWSEEMDIDLLLMIEKNYKANSFYDKFTVR